MNPGDDRSNPEPGIDQREMIRIMRATPLLQLTPLKVHTGGAFSRLFSNFSTNCTERHFLTAASRSMEPYEAAEYAIPDTVRKVVFAHLHDRISDLDLHSYVYIVALAVAARAGPAPALSEGSVFDERNYFWQLRDGVENSVSMTLKTLKTELKRVDSAIYKAVELIQCLDTVEELRVTPDEELEFERVTSHTCELAWDVFQTVGEMCDELGISVPSVYLKDQATNDKNFEKQQIILILSTIASIPLLKLQNYVEEVSNAVKQDEERKRELRSEMLRQKKILSKITEESGIYLAQNAVATKQFVYKPFAELTPEEQNEIKFESTANLYRYICMKRQLGIEPSMRLFQEKENTSLEKLTQDDLIAEQNTLKLQELERFRATAARNKEVLDQCIATAGAYQLLSKTQQLRELESVSLVSETRESPGHTISASFSSQQSPGSGARSILALSFEEYEVSVRNQLFQAFLSDFGTQDRIRLIVDVLLICRAIYAVEFFGDVSGYDKAFSTISTARFIDYSGSSVTDKSAQLRGAAQSSDEPHDDLEIDDLKNAAVPLVEPQAERLVELAEEALHADMLSSSVSETIRLRGQAQGPAVPTDPEQIGSEIARGISDFRLISDTILTSQLHVLFMHYIRWVSGRSRLEQREEETSRLSEGERAQRQAVELRVLSDYLGSMFIRGGGSIGYIVYIQTFSETIDQILLNPDLLDLFEDEEVGNLLIAMYKLPFYDDYFQLLKIGLKRALATPAIVETQIRAILKDAWVYAQNSGEDRELGRLLYDGQ